MTWTPGKSGYYAESATHTISRTYHGTHWVTALWDKQARKYLDFRQAVTLDEQKAAVLALKDFVSTASGTKAKVSK